ncbi:alpha/beta hydrolase [Shewanella sp. SM101]|uniref:alpha/beta fold hydrolase n=1 Tax=Shewanella sp. SM101 TaxID=2912789 RepID=UPI0021D85052|nr:alpha/beta hydrolase [Shewanella sp. SM101]MCU8105050.1 alpha/beta hydrolase [Shewanella sp. SM101]
MVILFYFGEIKRTTFQQLASSTPRLECRSYYLNSGEYYRALPKSVLQNKEILAQGKLKMPLLAISGNGLGSLGQTQIDQMNEYATQVEGHILDGCGHWLMEECPTQVEPLVLKFFNTK